MRDLWKLTVSAVREGAQEYLDNISWLASSRWFWYGILPAAVVLSFLKAFKIIPWL